jgi:hypothetical protein
VVYIVDPAEGWWEGAPEELAWREPAAGETNHTVILPFEAETGPLVPGRRLPGPSGTRPVTWSRASRWNSTVASSTTTLTTSAPREGQVHAQAEIEPSTFVHRGTEVGKGRVLTEPVLVEFETV